MRRNFALILIEDCFPILLVIPIPICDIIYGKSASAKGVDPWLTSKSELSDEKSVAAVNARCKALHWAFHLDMIIKDTRQMAAAAGIK